MWLPPTAGLGVSQTWINVTASRTQGAVYTNNTGKPISVAITGARGLYSSGFIAYVNGVELFRSSHNDTVHGGSAGGSFIVPSGSTYSVVAIGPYGGGTLISQWMELR